MSGKEEKDALYSEISKLAYYVSTLRPGPNFLIVLISGILKLAKKQGEASK